MRKTEDYNINLVSAEDIKEKRRKTEKKKFGLFDVVTAVIAAFVAVAIIFIFIFRVVTVEGSSMAPTLVDGDRVVVSAWGYSPEVGDVVVLSTKRGVKKPIVKRIIAVGGDVVDINFTTGVVTVNGVEEDYSDDLTTQQLNMAFPITVPEGTVFVLGDNRDDSLDSRSPLIGCIDERSIVGEVLFRFFPLGKWTVK